MILYNITFNVEQDVTVEWQEYFKTTHIPYLQEKPMIEEVKLLKLMTELPEVEGTTYTCQIRFKGQDQLEFFFNEVEVVFYNNLQERFSGKYVFFNTILQEL